MQEILLGFVIEWHVSLLGGTLVKGYVWLHETCAVVYPDGDLFQYFIAT